MSPTYSLDPVVRRVDDRGELSDLTDEQSVVIFDVGRERILDRTPRISFGRDVRRFVVTTDRWVESPGPSCRIKSPSTSRWLELKLTYEACCRSGQEGAMVTALGSASNPGSEVDRFLRGRVERFAEQVRGEKRDLALEFNELQQALCEYLAAEAESELHLTLRVAVEPKLSRQLIPHPIETGPFEVRPCDGSCTTTVECSSEAEVDAGSELRAMLFHQELADLAERVRMAIRDRVAQGVSLHELSRRTSNDVDQRLMEAVNASLKPLGRRVRYLSLSVTLDDSPEELLEIEHEVSCKIRELDEEIVVRHELILELRDAGTFRRSEVEDLGTWLRQQLDHATRTALFEKTYLDLLERGCADRVKDRIGEAATQVGYSVRHMVTVPDLEPLTWKDGFEVVCRDEEFPTADTDVEVGMEIIVHGRILERDLKQEPLKPYLRPDSELFTAMRGAILRRTRGILHEIPPSHFYFGFNRLPGEDGASIRSRLETDLGELLRREFCVSDLNVTPKPLETDLSERMSRLSQGPYRLEVPCTSLQGGERSVFHLEYRIRGIADRGWPLFLARKEIPVEKELSEIQETLSEGVQSIFGSVPPDALLYRDRPTQGQLSRLLETCYAKVHRSFGLEIELLDLRRDLTEGEKGHVAEVSENVTHAAEAEGVRRDALLRELDHLYDRRLKYLDSEMDPEEEEFVILESRLRAIHDQLSSFLGQQEGRSTPSLPAAQNTFDPREFQRGLFSLPGMESGHPRLAEGERDALPEPDRDRGDAE